MNGTNGERPETLTNFRLFRYFRLFRILSQPSHIANLMPLRYRSLYCFQLMRAGSSRQSISSIFARGFSANQRRKISLTSISERAAKPMRL
jgi:hypothetical protein